MFLYAGGQFDPSNPDSGLFKGKMLEKVSPESQIFIVADIPFQAFKAIFISLSASEALENERAKGTSSMRHHRGERWTRTHVAKLIGMKSVEPRAIL